MELTLEEAVAALRTFTTIHRTATSQKELLAYATVGISDEFSRENGALVSTDLTSGLPCSNRCTSCFGQKRHLVDVDSLLSGDQASSWRMMIEHDVFVLTPPGGNENEQVQFDLILCYNRDLPIADNPTEPRVNLNEHFYFKWDKKGDVADDLHGAIHIRNSINQQMFRRSNNGVKIDTICFDLDNWNLCDKRFVQIPHAVAEKVKSGKQSGAPKLKIEGWPYQNITLFNMLCQLFKSADNKGMYEVVDQIDVLLSNCLDGALDIASVNDLVDLLGDEAIVSTWEKVRQTLETPDHYIPTKNL